jgi:hypothetical protein
VVTGVCKNYNLLVIFYSYFFLFYFISLSVYIMRSKDLKTWQAGIYDDGVILKPINADDCKQISKEWSNWSPSPAALVLLGKNCTQWDNNSDGSVKNILFVYYFIYFYSFIFIFYSFFFIL